MEKKLRRLETFTARGSDGSHYDVHAYEHLARIDGVIDPRDEQWEPTGQAEYKLADGRHVSVARDGSMLVPDADLRLERTQRH